MASTPRGAQLLVGTEADQAMSPQGPGPLPLTRLERRRFSAPRLVDDVDDARLDRLVAVGSVDVRVHLQRVNRDIARRDAEGAYGALVDLFIALGPSVAEVRNRALYWARDVLAPHHYDALSAHVEQGLSPATPMPATLRSVRSRGVTGSTSLVGDGADDTPAQPVEHAPPHPPPARPAFVQNPGPTAPLGTTFVVDHTIVGVLRAHATPTAAFTLEGTFGRIAVAAQAVWIDLAPQGAALLASASFDGRIRPQHVDPQRVDRSGSRDLTGALWDLTVAVSAGRLPADLPADATVRLRQWPDLTRSARVDGDLRLAAILSRRAMRITELPDDSATRTFLAAAWVSGLLTLDQPAPAPEPAPATSSGPGAARRSVLRALVRRLRGHRG